MWHIYPVNILKSNEHSFMHKSSGNKNIRRYSLYIIPVRIIVISLLLLHDMGDLHTYNIDNKNTEPNAR